LLPDYLPQPLERSMLQPRDVHLRDPEAVRYLLLGHVVEVAK